MSWASTYVGIPHKPLGRDRTGLDCWGCLRLIYLEQLRIELPSYDRDYVCGNERALLDRLILDQRDSGPWHHVVDDLQQLDALLFRTGAYACHIATAVDARHMVHVFGDDCVKIEPIHSARWANRFLGAWRHEERRR